MTNEARYFNFFYIKERGDNKTETAIKKCKRPASCKEYQELMKRFEKGEFYSIGYATNPRAQELDDIEGACKVTYWRNPTKAEIKFGHGAIHYRDFKVSECRNKESKLKKWFIADDGLRYNY
jgi:hypothetical protein